MEVVMTKYKIINLGTFAEIGKLENGKMFLKDALGLTSCEISINNVPQAFKVPFYHKHKQNEEIYIILKGEGIITADNEKINVKEGSCIKIEPCASRTIENTGDNELHFICVQAKTNSLEQYGLGDAEIC